MRLRGAASMLWLAALAAWVGLLLLMNLRPPDAAGQLLFLVLFGAAVTCTLAPVMLLVRAPRSQSGTGVRVWSALRHAGLFGVLAMVLMTLQFLRLLNVISAVLLTAVVLLLEVLLTLRRAS